MTSDERITLRGTKVAAPDSDAPAIVSGPTPMDLITRLADATAGSGDVYQLIGPRIGRMWQDGDNDVPTGQVIGTYWDVVVRAPGTENQLIATLETPVADPLGPIQRASWYYPIRSIAVGAIVIDDVLGAIG